jgi:hypothetical protein
MTVLSACREAAIELSQPEPSSLFSTTDDFAKELRLQANRAAVAVAKAYDWLKLKAIHTITGDGATTAFELPSDYDRMLKDTDLLTSSFGWRLNKSVVQLGKGDEGSGSDGDHTAHSAAHAGDMDDAGWGADLGHGGLPRDDCQDLGAYLRPPRARPPGTGREHLNTVPRHRNELENWPICW